MQKILIPIAVVFFIAGLIIYPKQESKASVALPFVAPLPPAAGDAPAEPTPTQIPAKSASASVSVPSKTNLTTAGPLTPQRLSIPAIAFNNPIVKVGTNSAGEMDVPSGSTNNVGWYKNGTLPGNVGSAVIGAHVFAAFSRLDEVKAGNKIIVTMSDGSTRTFIVESATVYKLSDMSADRLFNRADARRLNLITCAGTLTADGRTYTHRLVISAVLAS